MPVIIREVDGPMLACGLMRGNELVMDVHRHHIFEVPLSVFDLPCDVEIAGRCGLGRKDGDKFEAVEKALALRRAEEEDVPSDWGGFVHMIISIYC